MEKTRFPICILFLCVCGWCAHTEARVFYIESGTDRISAVIPSIVSGDTLMLTTRGGFYHETNSIRLPAVPLTIMADPTFSSSPTWTSDGTRHIHVYHDLFVKGIHFDGRKRTDYGIRSHAAKPNKIVVENCEFHFFLKDGVTDNGVPVDTCIVKNTIFHDIGEVAIEFRTPDMCRNLIVENSTFYRIGERAVHIVEKHIPLTVRITNTTVHDCLGGMFFNHISDASVKNSIITKSRTYAVRTHNPLELVFNNTFQNTIDYNGQPAGMGCFNADPLFFDSDGGDFTLLPDSPCLTSGEEGEPLGDLRWTGQATISAGRRMAMVVWGRAAGVLVLVVGVGYASVVYVRKRVEKQSEQNYMKLLSSKTIQTLEDERRRLSRELHDQLGQDLVTISIQIEILRSRLKQAGDSFDSDLEELTTSVTEAIGNVREISYGLRPVMLDDLGLIPTLKWYTEAFSKRTGLHVCLNLENMQETHSDLLNIALYRIVQEALNNASKHAQATEIRICGMLRNGWITLKIEDDGIGFDVGRVRANSMAGGGLGLVHMAERAQSLNGSFHIVSGNGSGTRLRVRLPMVEDVDNG